MAHSSKVSKKSSDVDILVQLRKPLGLKFVTLANYLEKRLGRKVDLLTFDTLKRNLENPRSKHIALDIQRTLHYFGIDHETVRTIVKDELSDLLPQIEEILI